MANNILSYFTKGITNPIEKAKYETYTTCCAIYINYNNTTIFAHYYFTTMNKLLNIYKNAVYDETKSNRYLRNNKISYDNSYLSLNLNNNHKIIYKFKIKSYLLKHYLIYRYLLIWEFKFKIVYFKSYIYKQRHNFYLKRPYLNSLIFIPNKYELIFYSNLFSIFFAN